MPKTLRITARDLDVLEHMAQHGALGYISLARHFVRADKLGLDGQPEGPLAHRVKTRTSERFRDYLEAGLAAKRRYFDSVAKDWRLAYSLTPAGLRLLHQHDRAVDIEQLWVPTQHHIDHVIRTQLVVHTIAPGRPWLTEREWLARRERLAAPPPVDDGVKPGQSWLTAATKGSATGSSAATSAPDAVIPSDQGDIFVELDLGQYTSAQIKSKLAMATSGVARLVFVVPGPNRARKIARMATQSLPQSAWSKVLLATLGGDGAITNARSAEVIVTGKEQQRTG